MSFIPYLSFQGQCAAAFAAYADIFGGDARLMRFSDIPSGDDMPPLDEDQKSWVMHAQLFTPDGAVLMGADMPPQFGGKAQAGVSISVWRPDAAQAQALFDRLAEGGSIAMPFGETFFSKGFGMCTDRFGTSWMVNSRDPATYDEDA